LPIHEEDIEILEKQIYDLNKRLNYWIQVIAKNIRRTDSNTKILLEKIEGRKYGY